MLYTLQEADGLHDRGPHEHQWRLPTIRALRDSRVVGQVMPGIYRIPDIKARLVLWGPRPVRSRSTSGRPPSRRDHGGGSDPPKMGMKSAHIGAHMSSPVRAAPGGVKRGVALTTITRLVRCAGRGGDTPAAAPPRSSQPTRGFRAKPLPTRLSRQGPDHSSEGAPSESVALWLSKACATW